MGIPSTSCPNRGALRYIGKRRFVREERATCPGRGDSSFLPAAQGFGWADRQTQATRATESRIQEHVSLRAQVACAIGAHDDTLLASRALLPVEEKVQRRAGHGLAQGRKCNAAQVGERCVSALIQPLFEAVQGLAEPTLSWPKTAGATDRLANPHNPKVLSIPSILIFERMGVFGQHRLKYQMRGSGNSPEAVWRTHTACGTLVPSNPQTRQGGDMARIRGLSWPKTVVRTASAGSALPAVV